MYKGKLQEMCQKRGWGLPKYSCMKDGPDHRPRFKASVSVNGLSFHSSPSCTSSKIAHHQAAMHAFFHFSPHLSGFTISSAETDAAGLKNIEEAPHVKTFKELEHSAAKVALMSLLENGIQEDGSGFYKNMLNQITQRENLTMPIYKAINSGAPHMPIFIASVEIEGEIFYGKAGKSKKEGEMQAAKTAYLALKERAMNRSLGFSCSTSLDDRTDEPTFGSNSNEAVNLQQNLNHYDGVDELNSVTTMLDSLKIDNETVVVHKDKEKGNKDTPNCSEPVFAMWGEGKVYSDTEQPDISAFSTANSDTRKITAPRSYLLSNRFRVYTQYPGTDFPNDTIAMPISENRWMAFSLELPEAQGC